jgi:hypothetical protein
VHARIPSHHALQGLAAFHKPLHPLYATSSPSPLPDPRARSIRCFFPSGNFTFTSSCLLENPLWELIVVTVTGNQVCWREGNKSIFDESLSSISYFFSVVIIQSHRSDRRSCLNTRPPPPKHPLDSPTSSILLNLQSETRPTIVTAKPASVRIRDPSLSIGMLFVNWQLTRIRRCFNCLDHQSTSLHLPILWLLVRGRKDAVPNRRKHHRIASVS